MNLVHTYDAVSRLSRLLPTNAASQALEDFRYTKNLDDELEPLIAMSGAPRLLLAKTASPADAANRLAQMGTASYTFG